MGVVLQEPAVVAVPLRGHDFTGLGFNIYGNMRDGVFVKDVLHRGPASESGTISPGGSLVPLPPAGQALLLQLDSVSSPLPDSPGPPGPC